jgi:drug/metabolite transporter (DMT)-like permease
MHYDLLALAAAACWAFGSLLSVAPSRHLGAFAYTRWRMLIVGTLLWAATIVLHGLPAVSFSQFSMMAASGAIGIFVGDTANFSAMNRLGPRRAGVLFATNALFSALLGAVVFGERMSARAALGAGLAIAGVMTAILFGQRKSADHVWESNRGHPGVGIALALLAALCQAVGTLVAKPAMAENMDPITASAIRVSVACAAHFALLWFGAGFARPSHPATLRVLAQTAASGLVGMALGMTLLLLALRLGDVGMVAILSSVTPILLLPLLWLLLRRPPARGAWIGAGLTVVGTALILSR